MQATLAPEISAEVKAASAISVKKRFPKSWVLTLRDVLVLAVFGLALFVRLRVVEDLPSDYDEDDYLRAGQLYAQHISAGDLTGIINERENYEHPPLTKLAYGAVLVIFDGKASYEKPVEAGTGSVEARPEIARQGKSLRTFSAVIGALTAAVVAVVSLPAGIILALNSWHIKYTSQIYLEALPCLFATLTLFFAWRSRRNGDRWFWLSAVALGLTAAGKYLYSVGGFAVLGWFIWRDRKSWKKLLGWGVLALVMFYLADPALWPNPFGRLLDSITFNLNYTTGTQVQTTGFGWTQPLVWLFTAVPFLPKNHPEVFPLLMDGLFAILAVLALPQMWRTQRLVVLWAGVNLLFLFFWPTKWPQYILALAVPVALGVACWLQIRGQNILKSWQNWRGDGGKTWRDTRQALPWLAPALLLFAIIVVYPMILQIALAMTNFQVRNIRAGVPGLLEGFGRGLLGLPPDNNPPLPYFGTGSFFYMFGDEAFFPTLRFNILWVAISMALATAFGLWLASLLQRRGVWGRTAWRTLFILPWAMPEFVGALIWSTIFDDSSGGVNNFSNSLGAAPIDWLSSPKPLINVIELVKPLVTTVKGWHLDPLAGIIAALAEAFSFTPGAIVMVIVAVWVAFPFMMMVGTVALRAIPGEVYDAGRVDGALGWNMWRFITWPLIKPSIWSGVLLRGILLFNAFQIPLVLIRDSQRTGTNTFALYGYYAIRFGNGYSIAALMNIVVMGIAIGLIWWFNRRTRVVEGVDYV
jgi:ABC-type sugar transport system permease subunit